MKKKYTDKFIEDIKVLYVEKRWQLSRISKSHKIPAKTLYRWKKQGDWDRYLRDQAKIMYVDEQKKIPEIAKTLKKSVNEILRWKKEDKWDKDIFLSGTIGIGREAYKQFIEDVKKALKENNFSNPGIVDKFSKQLKVLDRLAPHRIMLSNIFQLLHDLTDFVIKLGDNEFANKFQKYIPEISDFLREKYSE